MQTFTIRDIENLTGIKAHTWRIWEQRYDFFQPDRKESKHRIYSDKDLQQLLQISFLYHTGLKVSKIAALSEQERIEQINYVPLTNENFSLYIYKLIEAAIEFNEEKFCSIISEVTELTGFEKCVTEFCFPYLQKIGLLWLTHNVIPSQEHFSSYIIQNKIIAETNKLPAATGEGKSILLFTPEAEHHELSLLYIYAQEKWVENYLYWEEYQNEYNSPFYCICKG